MIKKTRFISSTAIIIYFALAKLIIHLLTNTQYGYFRDEFYFLAASEHLSWGYVDFPPLVAFIGKVATTLFGTSIFAIRFLPAIAGAIKVLLTGFIIKELGGKRFAVFLGCLCVMVVPAYLILDTFFSMNTFEPVLWMAAAYFIILAVKRNEPRYFIGFGIMAGLCIMNKHAAVFFIFSLLLGLILTKERRFIKSRWFWIGMVIAFIIVLPNIIWQLNHNFATLEFIKATSAEGKNVAVTPISFILQQFFILNPLTAIVWIAGIYYFIFIAKPLRSLGFAFLTLFLLWMVTGGKHYYVVPVYPMLFAAGAVFWEKKGFRWKKPIKICYLILLIISGIIFAPIVLPILPVESFLAYEKVFNLAPPKTEVGHIGPLPQYFGDMFGWPEMVDKVARVYNGLPPEERSKTAIFAHNYGEAGAVDLLGGKYGLPKAISGHLNYYLWGPRNYTGEITILLGYEKKEVAEICGSIEEKEVVSHPYSMAEEHFTILVCRDSIKPLKELWPETKDWS